MELWRMRPDGGGEFQITDTPEWQEGGAFYLPDSEHILFRAWRREDQESSPLPMTLFTIKHDGTELTQLTHDEGTNWAPYPSPDGKHLVFVKVPEPHNYEVFLMNMETGKQTQLTYDPAFDGFPAFAPDGRTIAFASNRDQEAGSGTMAIYLMDVGPLLED
jgi:Tol biopolymer transport system component